jgi:hypothetical protein
MSTPRRTTSELIALAQKDGWHQDPLGREIIAELAARKPIPTAAKLSIAVLAGLLAVAFIVIADQRAKGSALEARIVSAQAIEEGLKAQIASDAKDYENLRSSSDLIGKTRDEAKSEVMKALNERIDRLTRENEQLKVENVALKTAADKR